VQVDGRNVSTRPRNPAQAAAQQQELAEAARTAQILGAMFPEEFKMNMDGRKTMEDWIEKSRTGAVLQLRPIDQVSKARRPDGEARWRPPCRRR